MSRYLGLNFINVAIVNLYFCRINDIDRQMLSKWNDTRLQWMYLHCNCNFICVLLNILTASNTWIVRFIHMPWLYYICWNIKGRFCKIFPVKLALNVTSVLQNSVRQQGHMIWKVYILQVGNINQWQKS